MRLCRYRVVCFQSDFLSSGGGVRYFDDSHPVQLRGRRGSELRVRAGYHLLAFNPGQGVRVYSRVNMQRRRALFPDRDRYILDMDNAPVDQPGAEAGMDSPLGRLPWCIRVGDGIGVSEFPPDADVVLRCHENEGKYAERGKPEYREVT